MAAFTTIAAATVSIGGSALKGALAGDAAKTAARESGRLRLEQENLEKQSVARLEQNFYDAVRATTDVYDRQLRGGNAFGAQLLESIQEGDQRGVAAGAGKIKQVQDATLGEISDKFAKQKIDIDMARAKAGEMSASEIAAYEDDRAASAGLKADALSAQADKLKGQSTGAFIDAGVSAFQTGASVVGGLKGKAGSKAAEKLSTSEGISIDEARSRISKYTGEEIRQFNRGDIKSIDISGRSNVSSGVPSPEINVTNNNESVGESITNLSGVTSQPVDTSMAAMFYKFFEEQEKKKEEEEEKAGYDFNKVLNSFKSGNYIDFNE